MRTSWFCRTCKTELKVVSEVIKIFDAITYFIISCVGVYIKESELTLLPSKVVFSLISSTMHATLSSYILATCLLSSLSTNTSHELILIYCVLGPTKIK